MKKLLIVGVVILLAVPVFAAPTQKGNFVVSLPLIQWESASGDLYENAEGDAQTYLALGALGYQFQVEWFVIDNLAIGGVIGYVSDKQGDVEDTAMIFGPMVTYYYAMGQIIPYAGIGYIYSSSESDDGTTSAETTDTSLLFKVGAAYMLGNNLSLFGEFAYSMDTSEPDGGDSVDGTVMSIAVGVKAFF